MPDRGAGEALLRSVRLVHGRDTCDDAGRPLATYTCDYHQGYEAGYEDGLEAADRCPFCHDPLSEHTAAERRSCEMGMERRDLERRMG